MQVKFGIDHRTFTQERKNMDAVWDSARVINGHILVVGKSGTGKTYTLRKILKQMLPQAKSNLRVHIFDELQHFLMICFCFARETGDQRCSEGNIRDFFS